MRHKSTRTGREVEQQQEQDQEDTNENKNMGETQEHTNREGG